VQKDLYTTIYLIAISKETIPPHVPQHTIHPLPRKIHNLYLSSGLERSGTAPVLSSSPNPVKVLHSLRFLVGNVAEIISIPSNCLVQNFTTERSCLGTSLELMKRMSSSRMFVACSLSLSGTQGTLFLALMVVSFNVLLLLSLCLGINLRYD
jgi:hypothetical protein